MNMRTLIVLLIFISASIVTAGKNNRHFKVKRGQLYGYDRGYGYGAALPGEEDRPSRPIYTSGLTLSSSSATDSASGLTLSSAPADDGGDPIVEVPAPDLTATLTASYQAEEGPHYGSGKLPANNDGSSDGSGAGSNDDKSANDINHIDTNSYGTSDGNTGSFDAESDVDERSNNGQATTERQLGEPYLISVHREIIRKFGVPVSRLYPVPVPVNVYVKIEKPVPVSVDKPYAVRVNVPHPVAVDRPFPVPVDRPYSVPIPRAVPVAVPRPYPVLVPHPVPFPVVGTVQSHSGLAAARTIGQTLSLPPPGLAVGVAGNVFNNNLLVPPASAIPAY